jgi:pimeloyl-ACP methyl ester carboxylesterase
MAEDLHTLLVNAQVPGPYILVGHSLGGLTVRFYADRYPEDVVGMVLVEAAHPDEPQQAMALVTPELLDENTSVRTWYQGMTQVDPTKNPEYWDLETSFEQARALGALGSLPLVVLTRDPEDPEPQLQLIQRFIGPGFPAELSQEIDRGFLSLQQELAALSTESSHTIVSGTSHLMPMDRPDAIVDAIQTVVERVRAE